MGLTTDKGEIGEAEVIADLRRRGHGVAIPFGHSLPFDLVLVRRDTGALERVQVKYTTSDGRVVKVRCSSYSAWVSYRYQATTVDWIAVFDASGRRVYYIPLLPMGRINDGEPSTGTNREQPSNLREMGRRLHRARLLQVHLQGQLMATDSQAASSRRGELNP